MRQFYNNEFTFRKLTIRWKYTQKNIFGKLARTEITCFQFIRFHRKKTFFTYFYKVNSLIKNLEGAYVPWYKLMWHHNRCTANTNVLHLECCSSQMGTHSRYTKLVKKALEIYGCPSGYRKKYQEILYQINVSLW